MMLLRTSLVVRLVVRDFSGMRTLALWVSDEPVNLFVPVFVDVCPLHVFLSSLLYPYPCLHIIQAPFLVALV